MQHNGTLVWLLFVDDIINYRIFCALAQLQKLCPLQRNTITQYALTNRLPLYKQQYNIIQCRYQDSPCWVLPCTELWPSSEGACHASVTIKKNTMICKFNNTNQSNVARQIVQWHAETITCMLWQTCVVGLWILYYYVTLSHLRSKEFQVLKIS